MKIFPNRVTVLGSVHSTADVIPRLHALKPSLVLVELCKQRLDALENGKGRATDMCAVLKYCSTRKIKVEPIDQCVYLTVNEFHNSLSPAALRDVLWFLSMRTVFRRLAAIAFCIEASRSSRGYDPVDFLSRFISDWLISPTQINKALEIAKLTRNSDKALQAICPEPADVGNPFSFEFPNAYKRLCEKHGIDQILNRVLLRDRDRIMAAAVLEKIRDLPESESVAVVVGENHVTGLSELLKPGIYFAPKIAETITPTLSDVFKLKMLERLLK
jgi:hypothetical protein